MTTELLPCPHCGSAASVHTMPNDGNCNDGGQFVMCNNSRCMAASALVFPLMDSALPTLTERWNRRADAKEDELETLRIGGKTYQVHADVVIAMERLCSNAAAKQPPSGSVTNSAPTE